MQARVGLPQTEAIASSTRAPFWRWELLLAGAWVTSALLLLGNNLRQMRWLERKWLFREPLGLQWMAGFVALSAAATGLLAWIHWSRRWRARAGAPLSWLWVLVALAWMWPWRLDLPPLVYDLHLAFVSAGALWVGLVCLHATLGDRAWWRWILHGSRLLGVLAASLILAEIGLRGARSLFQLSWLATAGTSVDSWIAANRLRPGTFYFGFPVNSLGHVDVEPEVARTRKKRVIVVGDSFSVAVVPHAWNYTTLAERYFDDLEVYNLGVAGAGPREYRRLLELHAASIQPELVVLALFVGNDIEEAERAPPDWVESWCSKREVLVLQASARLRRLKNERAFAGALGGAGLTSGVYGIPSNQAFSNQQIVARMPWLLDPLLEPPGLSEARYNYVECHRARILLSENHARYQRLQQEVEAIAAALAPIPIACLLIPDAYQVDDALWAEIVRRGLPAATERAAAQRLLSEWLQSQGIPVLDLLPRLLAVAPLPDGDRHLYHLRDTHFNARGNAHAGAALAEWIESQGIAQRARK